MTTTYARVGHVFRWVKLVVDGETWRMIDEDDMSDQLQEGMEVSLILDGNNLITQIDWQINN